MGWALSYRYSLEKSVPRIRDLSDILAEMESSLTAYSNVGMFQYYINFTNCYAHTYCVRQPRKTSSLTTTKELLPVCQAEFGSMLGKISVLVFQQKGRTAVLPFRVFVGNIVQMLLSSRAIPMVKHIFCAWSCTLLVSCLVRKCSGCASHAGEDG